MFMLLLAVFVVMEFSTIVTGPDDLAFYSPLPVPPRAYVSAKITVTLVLGVVFALVYFLAAALEAPVIGAGFLAGLFVVLLDGALISVLLVIVVLGLVVRFVSFRRVREVAAWVQLIIFIAVYGGFFVVQRAMSGSGMYLESGPVLMIAPSAWAASALLGGAGRLPRIGAGLAIAIPLLLFFGSIRVVSQAYDGKLAEAEVVSIRVRRRGRVPGSGSLLWRSPEERGIALLISNFLRSDNQFRMGVLTIIPVTLLYLAILLLGVRSPILDPFTPAGRATFGRTILLYLAVGFFPSYLRSALTFSAQAEASWLFHVSPANRLLMLRAARRFILLFFVAPYVLLLAVLNAVLTREILHTVMHFLAISLLVVIEIDLLLLFFPRIPFSRPASLGRRGGSALGRMLNGFLIVVPIWLLVTFVYPHLLVYWLVMAALVAVLIVVRVRGRRFAARRLEREEYSI